MELRVSILVPTFNSAQSVRATLNGIVEQDFEEPVEFQVIDDGSTDKTVEVCEVLGIPVHQNERNVGIAASLSRAIRLSHADIIVILHPDTIPLSNHWLS